MHPQSEVIKRRRFTTRFVENIRQGKKAKASITANFEDSSDSDDNFMPTPGPGSYYNPNEKAATVKSEEMPFQYFGSTSPRFPQTDPYKVPGPGTYKELVQIPRNQGQLTSVFKNEGKFLRDFDT